MSAASGAGVDRLRPLGFHIKQPATRIPDVAIVRFCYDLLPPGQHSFSLSSWPLCYIRFGGRRLRLPQLLAAPNAPPTYVAPGGRGRGSHRLIGAYTLPLPLAIRG